MVTSLSEPGSLVDAAVDLYYRSRYDTARVLLNRALAAAIHRNDTVVQARALTWLGSVAWRQGDYEEALARGEEGLRLKLETGLDAELWRSYNALGLLAWYESRLTDAADHFDRAADAARLVGDEEGLAKVADNQGLIHFDLGNFAEARHSFETAIEAGRALGDPQIEGNGLTNLAMLEILLGNPRSAIRRLEIARRLYAQIDYVRGEENALGQLATAFLAIGEVDRAYAKVDSALRLARERQTLSEEAINLELLADLYSSTGDQRRALQHYGEAKEINDELGDETYAGVDLRSEAVIYTSLGDLGAALERAASALEKHRSAGARYQELQDLLVLAEIAHLRRRPADGRRHLREAKHLAASFAGRAGGVDVALTEARIADAKGEARAVLEALRPIEGDLKRGDYQAEWEAEWLRSRAYHRLGDLDAAVAAGRKAVNASERVRRNLASGVLRTSFTAARAETYADLVAMLLRRGDVAEAFQVADAMRGYTLREYVSSAARVNVDATAGTMAEGEELLRRIGQIAATLDTLETIDPVMARTLATRLGDSRDRYETLLIELAEGNAVDAAALGASHVDPRDVQRVLRPDEILLQYLVTPERLVIFIVSPDGFRVAESTISTANLTSRVRVARELIGRPDSDPEALRDVLSELFGILIEPAARTGSIYQASSLIIVPHGVLTYAPFVALRDGVTGRYLAESFAVLNLPSASALPLLRAASRNRSNERAASSEASYVFAPFPVSLPATAGEAEAAASVLPAASVNLGPAATEPRLRQALNDGGVVHVATHGALNTRNPMFSMLQLAVGDGDRAEDDGRLEVHEILGLDIRGQLVYLSGCETGLGRAWSTRFMPGEDYATLSRAFLYAGAANVIATLWRIEDRSAADFAASFYRELEAASPVEALARTQRAMIASDDRSAPYYWAAYRLSGTGT